MWARYFLLIGMEYGFNQTFSYFCFNRKPDFFRLFFQFIHLNVFLVQTERLFTGVSMKKLIFPFTLGLSMMVGFGVNIPVLNAKTPSKPNPSVANPCEEAQDGCAAESVPLYYNRSASAIKAILEKIVGDGKSGKFAGTFIGENGTGTGEASGKNDNVIVLYGTDENRKKLKRIIAILDLPRERVNMEMWGILISSNNPGQLAEVMDRVNKEIDKTQQLLQETYNQIKKYSINYALNAANNDYLNEATVYTQVESELVVCQA
jgi:hypothetical protein